MKQDLATKKIEQLLKQEIERQRLNETLCMTRPEPETGEDSVSRGDCNTLRMVTGKPFGITKNGARIMSKITVGGHELTRNLSEPSDQMIMHIDVYAGYLSAISPQTPSRALRALLTRGGSKSVRRDNRKTEAYGPHEVMLNIDGISIYTKTMITCDEDLAGNVYVGREELKVRSIGHCAILEEDAMHIGTETDLSAHVLDIDCTIRHSSSLVKSPKSDTDDGLSSCSNFPERPTLVEELEMDKPVLPEIEHLRSKVTNEQLKAIKVVLDWNQDVFRNTKQTLDVAILLNTK